MTGNRYLTYEERQARKLELLRRKKEANCAMLNIALFIAGMALMVSSIPYDWDSDLFTSGLIWMIVAVIGYVGRRVEIDPEEYADYPDFDEEEYEWMDDEEDEDAWRIK